MLITALVQIAQGSRTSDVYFYDAVLVALILESIGASGHAHANSSSNALASLRSNVSKPSVNQLYTGASSS